MVSMGNTTVDICSKKKMTGQPLLMYECNVQQQTPRTIQVEVLGGRWDYMYEEIFTTMLLFGQQQQLCLISEIRTLLVSISDTKWRIVLDMSVRCRGTICQYKDDKALAIYDSNHSSLSAISLEAPNGNNIIATKDGVSIALNTSLYTRNYIL
jgi:hypothetical protein